MRRTSLRRADQQRTGTCLTPVSIQTPSEIILSQSDIEQFQTNLNMDMSILADLARSVKKLGSSQTVRDALDARKVVFDGSNADIFAKWLQVMDDIHVELDHDDAQTLAAASLTLKGSAFDFYRETKRQVATWTQLKDALITRYAHLNPAPRSKQKIKTALQQANETISDFAERIRTLGHQAYSDRLEEKEVTEILTNAFINGLRDRRLQENVARKMPPTLAEAYKHALHEQQVREHISLFKDNTSAPEPMDCDVVTKDRDELKDKLNQVTEDINNIKQILLTQLAAAQAQNSSTTPTPRPTGQFQVQPQVRQHYGGRQGNMQGQGGNGQNRTNNRPQSQGYQWTTDNRPICHYCGLAGHVQRACRKRRADYDAGQRHQQQQQGN